MGGTSSRFQRTGSPPEEKKEESASGSRFGLGSFRRGGATEEKKPDDKKDSPPGGGPSSRLSAGGRTSAPEEKKDAPSGTGGLGSRFGLGGRGATEEKKDAPASGGSSSRLSAGGRTSAPEEKKDAPSSTGGLGSRFGIGGRGATEEKKDTPASGGPSSRFSAGGRTSAPEEKKDAPSSTGGLGSRFGIGGRGATEEKKPEEKKDDSSGGSRFGIGGFRRGGATEEKKPEEKKDAPASSGASSRFQQRAGSPPASATPAAKPVAATTAAAPAKPRSNRAASKPLPTTGNTRLPKFVKVGPSLDFQLDMVGGVMVFAALILISGMISPGTATGTIDSYLAQLFGVGRVLVPLSMLAVGGWLLVSRFGSSMFEIEYFRILGAILLFIIVMATLQWGFLFSEVVPTYDVLEQNSEVMWQDGDGGGLVGHIVYIFFARQLGDYPVVVFFAFWWMFALMLTFKTSPSQVMEQGRNVSHSLQVRREASRARREAKRADIAALAAAEVAAALPVVGERAPTQAVGRTTTPEQDAAKAAVTPEAPVRQTTETVAPTEEKSSRFGRLLRGDKVTVEKAEESTEGRTTSEPAQEERKMRFGLPGRRTAAQPESDIKPAETPAEKPAEAVAESSEGATGGRLGLFNRGLRRKSEEEAKPDEKSSEQVAGRRLSATQAEPASEAKSTDAPTPETQPQEEKTGGHGRLGRLGVGRLMNRGATEAAETTTDKTAETPAAPETVSPEKTEGRSRFGGGLFQRSKPTEAEKSAETAPISENNLAEHPAETTSTNESSVPKRALGGLTSRWAGRKAPDEEAKSDQPASETGRTAENPPASETAPQRRLSGLMGRLAGGTAETAPETPTPIVPSTPITETSSESPVTAVVETAIPQVEVQPAAPLAERQPVESSDGGNRYTDLRARRLAAIQGEQPTSSVAASTPFSRRLSGGADESSTEQPAWKGRDLLARTAEDSQPLQSPPPAETSAESAPETPAQTAENPPESEVSAEIPNHIPETSPPVESTGAVPPPEISVESALPVESESPVRRPFGIQSTQPSLFGRRESDRPARPMGIRQQLAAEMPAVATESETSSESAEPKPATTESPVVEAVQESTDEPIEEIKPAQPRGVFNAATPENPSQIAGLAATAVTAEQVDAQLEAIFTPPVETPVESAASIAEPVMETPPPSVAAVPEPKTEQPEPAIVVEKLPEPEENAVPQWKAPEFMSILEAGHEQEVNQHYLLEQARIIEDTLSSFGAPGKVVEVNSGPVITQFGIEPDYIERRGGRTRVKVSAIAALEKDIALALAAKTIRIEAPVPGKGFVGIEVPNIEAAVVTLRDVMTSEPHQKMVQKSPLAISLGKGVDGTPVSADLTAMPHLLIAGTTGSGKSVCVNAIISCLLLQNSPEQLQLIMVDPKRVELTGYNGIPHLISNVVVDLERIVGVLKWVQREMDERYRKLNERAARNIQDYNRRMPDDAKMPYLVVIIDELADLMMLAPDETEKLIARLAQMARATGIHLIISTQRPSVDVVTGLIKANFPARIAFAVASGTDSRVILDAPGADRLLGKGDMLFQSPDASAPVRMQGVYVSDMEIERITRYWKEQAIMVRRGVPNIVKMGEEMPHRPAQMPVGRTDRYGVPSEIRPMPRPQGNQQAFWKEVDELAAQRDDDDDLPEGEEDEMYDEAVKIVRQLEKASISLLQRRLRIGYTRAARLIDMMESRGVIGPGTDGSSKPRDVISRGDED